MIVVPKQPHPNIISILDIGEDPEMGPFYVMEWMHGGDLKSLLTESPNRVIDPGKAISIVQDILAALEAAHSSGIIHRDVKPSNILFDSTGRAKLADFGIATAISANNIEAARGTPGYMAPEQLETIRKQAIPSLHSRPCTIRTVRTAGFPENLIKPCKN